MIHAGGILFYDDKGIWVIKEYHKDIYKISDPGGKYTFEDCNIYATIVREFNEETYYSFPFSYFDLINLIEKKKCKFIYVCLDNEKNPTYLCILVNIKDTNIIFDETFKTNRQKALENNPHIPNRYYSSFEFLRINFKDINLFWSYFNYRLKQVVYKTFLKKYLGSPMIISKE